MHGVFYEGIDASSLEATMNMFGVPQEEREELFWNMQILEREARIWRNKR